MRHERTPQRVPMRHNPRGAWAKRIIELHPTDQSETFGRRLGCTYRVEGQDGRDRWAAHVSREDWPWETCRELRGGIKHELVRRHDLPESLDVPLALQLRLHPVQESDDEPDLVYAVVHSVLVPEVAPQALPPARPLVLTQRAPLRILYDVYPLLRRRVSLHDADTQHVARIDLSLADLDHLRDPARATVLEGHNDTTIVVDTDLVGDRTAPAPVAYSRHRIHQAARGFRQIRVQADGAAVVLDGIPGTALLTRFEKAVSTRGI